MTAAGWFAREARLPSAVGRTQVTTARALRHLPGTDQAWLDGRITREHVRVLDRGGEPRIRRPHRHARARADRHRRGPHLPSTGASASPRWSPELDTEGPDPDDPTHTTASWGRVGAVRRAPRQVRRRRGRAPRTDHRGPRPTRLFRPTSTSTSRPPTCRCCPASQLRAHAIIDLILHGPDTRTTPHRHATSRDTPRRHRRRHRRRTRRRHRRDARARSSEVDEASGKKVPKRTKNPLRVGVTLVLRPRRTTPRSARAPEPSAGSPGRSPTPRAATCALDHFASLLCDCRPPTPCWSTTATTRSTSGPQRPLLSPPTTPHRDHPRRRLRHARLRLPRRLGRDPPRRASTPRAAPPTIVILVALCRRHHGITHRKGWTMHATGDGWFWWTTPSGDTFWSQRHGRQRAGPTPHQRRIAA